MSATARHLEIWLADLKQLEPVLEAAERRTGYLAPSERAWNAPPGGGASVRRLCRIVLRILLARRDEHDAIGTEFEVEPHGRPRLRAGSQHFSVSHTRDHALIAIAGAGPIGVDLEGDRRLQLSAARQSLMVAAADALARTRATGEGLTEDLHQRSLQAWTVLEAFAKARGTGIGALLTDLGITAAGTRDLSMGDMAERARSLSAVTGLRVCPVSMPTGCYAALAVPDAMSPAHIAVQALEARHCDA